jgi:hypothetical protein
VQSQFIAKSGGNQFNGEYYLDWYNNSLQGANIPEEYTVPTAFRNSPIREHSNEIDRYYDTAINVGGPIKRDKIWWFGTYRTQFNAIQQPNFQFDKTFDTKLWNAIGKGTYQINQKHKIVGYYQWGQKIQPNRLPGCTGCGSNNYLSEDPTNRQDSGSWVYKAEWNGTLSDKLYVEARYGDFGYYFPQITNGTEPYFFRDNGRLEILGSHQKNQNDRDRKQWTGAATYFLDSATGSHTFKLGGEILKELQWFGVLQGVGGNIEHVYNNGTANQLIFRIPTATQVGGLKDNDNGHLTTRNALDQTSLFLNDTWSVGRFTLNGGVRWDRYSGWLPEQQQLASTIGPAAIHLQAKTFPEADLFTWNLVAPRIGVVYDLRGDGRTVLKGNYGLYWHNPGVGVPSNVNPNTGTKSATYGWNDVNGDRRWQAGEETNLQQATLEGATRLDPNLKGSYSHEAAGWFEQQFTDTLGFRTGFVYKTEDDLMELYIPTRGADVYTTSGVPFTFTDLGVDGVRGTADDRALSYVGLPSANAATLFPTTQVQMNLPKYGRYKTAEVSFNKRYGNRWSASIGGAHTWITDFPNDFPQNPNQPGAEDRTQWNLKASGSYDAAWGIRLSPVLRHQSGAHYARTNQISYPAGLTGSGNTVYMEPMSANREDNIWVFDVRAEKTLSLTSRARARLFFDLFNITNSHASETISRATGTGYQKPSAILAPITARVGFRFLW